MAIPKWYDNGIMQGVPRPGRSADPTTQITVRIPAELVDHVDAAVAAGNVASRAAYVARALQRQRDREADEHDLLVLLAERAAGVAPDDLDALAEWSAGQPLDVD